MSDTKFTPGPWKLNAGMSDWGLPLQHDVFVGEGDTERDLIAGIPSITPYCMGAKRSDIDYAAQQWHNACLISAAPEMYEALEGIESLFGPDTPFILTKLHGLMTNGDQDKIDAVFGKIMHAIAKAQGVR